MAVAHLQLGRGIGHGLAALLHGCHQRDHVFQLTAVSARVHIGRAAHGAGNARGKFQPGQAVIRRRLAELLQGRARLRCDGEAAVRQGRGVADLGKTLSQMNDQPTDAAVLHQQVGAVADQRDRHVQLPSRLKRGAELLRSVRFAQKLSRAAQMQRGITAHGDVFHQLFFGENRQQPFVQRLHGSRFHGASPFVPQTRGSNSDSDCIAVWAGCQNETGKSVRQNAGGHALRGKTGFVSR